MALIELIVSVADADAFADALLEAGALSVGIEDALAGGDEHPIYGEPGESASPAQWPSSRLRILVDAGQAERVLATASAACAIAAPGVESMAPVRDADWVRESQADFEPIGISARLWVIASWHPAPAAPVVIRLDPGAAFGTGAHPTTKLCLRWLDDHLQPGARLLDYGCGSGILAIAAAKLGAGRVDGVDIDPAAVATAQANSAANGVVASYTDPDSLGSGTYDVVIANILASPLQVLAPALSARVAPRGSLVLSGVLQRQADEVIAAYRRADDGLELATVATDEGWVCLAATRQ